jgi:hypothetical protein
MKMAADVNRRAEEERLRRLQLQVIGHTFSNQIVTVPYPIYLSSAPDPGSSAFLTTPGSGMNIPDLIFENLVSDFLVKNT